MKVNMKANFISVIGVVGLFFIFPLMLFAEVDANEKVLNGLIERAKLFGEILEHGQPSDLSKMFKPTHPKYSEITVNLTLRGDKKNTESTDEIQGYTIFIGNSEINKITNNDTVFLRMYKNLNETNDAEHVIAEYSDFISATINVKQLLISFDRKSKPRDCRIFYGSIYNDNPEISTTIKWDEDGNIISKKNLNFITEKNVKVHPLPRFGQVKLNDRNAKPAHSFFAFKPIKTPNTSDKKSEDVFKRIGYLADMSKPRDLAQAFTWELTAENAGGSIHCVNDKVRAINFSTYQQGYFLSIDEDGKILAYAEGVVDEGEVRSFENYYNNTNKSRNFFWHPPLVFAPISKGIEVTFHSNGHPATYRTIEQNHLRGRQIEWNDKGNIISNVNLDTPKPLPDTEKNQQK
ncbi:MAG: hypothetical protein LBQ66_06860 [Planctomycetaceae bacterium]|nr:hypothetical protein [Planctomycetaceae bacterium]